MRNLNKIKKIAAAVVLALLATVQLAQQVTAQQIPQIPEQNQGGFNGPGLRGPSCPAGPPLLWENMAYEVDSRIAGIGASSATRDIWLTRGNAQGGWQRNPNVWTNRGATPLDLTGVSPWNSFSGYQRAGTLITPRIFMQADHFPIPPGSTIVFVDNQNNVATGTVVDTRRVGSTDIQVGLLNSPVPPSIAHYPLISKTDLLATTPNESTYTKILGHQVPIIMSNQFDRAIVVETTSLRADRVLLGKIPPAVGTQRHAFYEELILHDSGDMNMAIINGKLAMLAAHQFTNAGPNYVNYQNLPDAPGITDIQEAITAMLPGHQLETFDMEANCIEGNMAPVFSQNSYIFNIPTNYTAGTIVGRVPATDANTSNDVLNYTLTGHQTNQFSINQNTGDITILQAGLLNQPNTSLTFTANVRDDWFSPMTDTALVTVTNSPPCPVDFNHNGVVDVADIFAFLNAWFAGNPSADTNDNGSLGVDDIFTFISIWFVGC